MIYPLSEMNRIKNNTVLKMTIDDTLMPNTTGS